MRTWGTAEKPAVVLAHGFMQSPHTWDAAAKKLSDHFFVLAPTFNTVAMHNAGIAAMCARIDDAVRIGIQETGRKRVSLVGYSMGGRMALEYARTHEKLLSCLVLESAGLGPESDAQREEFAKRADDWADRLRTEPFDDFLDYWENLPLFATQRELSVSARESLRLARTACDPHILAAQVSGAGLHRMHSQERNLTFLMQADLPVLYLAGRKDTRYAGLAQDMRDAGFETRLFECGHNVHLECPDEFCAIVYEYLKKQQRKPMLEE